MRFWSDLKHPQDIHLNDAVDALRPYAPVSLDVGQHVSAHAFRQSRDVVRGLAAASGGLLVPQLEHVWYTQMGM